MKLEQAQVIASDPMLHRSQCKDRMPYRLLCVPPGNQFLSQPQAIARAPGVQPRLDAHAHSPVTVVVARPQPNVAVKTIFPFGKPAEE